MSVFNSCNWWTNQDAAKMADKDDDDEVCLLDAPLEEATTPKALAAGFNENRIASEHVVALHQLLEPEYDETEKRPIEGEMVPVVAEGDAAAKKTCDNLSAEESEKDNAESSDKPTSSLVWVTDDFELPSTEELFSDLGIWW